MRSHSWKGLLIAIGAITLLGSACGGDDSDAERAQAGEDAGDGDAPATPSTETLVVDWTFDRAILDPSQGTSTTVMTNWARFDTLMRFEGTELQPHLAVGFEASPDNREFTFALRDDVEFADGTPLTAADVVFTYNRALGLKLEGSRLLGAVTASAPDEHTVVLTSSEPNAAIPAIVATPVLGIFNAELARAHGATDAADAAETDTAEEWFSSGESRGAGSGPYVLVENSAGDQIRLERNENFWGEPAGYAQVVIRNVAAETQALNVRRGSHEIALSLGANELAGLQRDPNLNVITEPSTQQIHLFSNINPEVSPVSSNEHFKQAIRYAIDYDAIMELAGPDAARASTVVPAALPGVLPLDEATDRDLEKAEEELAASGVENPSITLEYVGGVSTGGVPNDSIAQIVQRSLQEAGIEVSLQAQPQALLLERYLAGQIAWGIVPAATLLPDAAFTATYGPGGFIGRLGGWQDGANPSLEELISEAERASEDERLDLWQDVQRRMADEGPWIPLVAPVAVMATTGDVSGTAFMAGSRLDFRSVHPAS